MFVLLISNHRVFLVQFGISLPEWVEIARAASASYGAISAFWKTHKCKFISNWTRKPVWLLIKSTNMKKSAHFFRIQEKAFQSFRKKLLSLLYMISLAYKISHCLSANLNPRITMCNLHRCYTFRTGVTLFALVLHLKCTALSQSESSNFFMCIFIWVTTYLQRRPLIC